jgi:sugar phosphate isomerase/epimerase
MQAPGELVFCAGTLLRGSFDELVRAASAGGFRGLSLWPRHAEAARAGGRSDAELRARVADAGIAVHEIEPLLAWLPEGSLAPEHAKLAGPPPAVFFELAEALGAQSVLAVDGFGARAGIDALVAAFAELCDAAAGRGLEVKLEFTPWSAVPDAATAERIVREAGRPNAGIVVDSWHFFRGGGEPDQLRDLPGALVRGVQINDGPREPGDPDLARESLHARRLPGEGELDLVGFVTALDAIGSAAPIGVEVFSDELAGLGPEALGRRAGESTRALLAAARPGRP